MGTIYSEALRLYRQYGLDFAEAWYLRADKFLSELPKNASESDKQRVMNTAAQVVAYRLQ